MANAEIMAASGAARNVVTVQLHRLRKEGVVDKKEAFMMGGRGRQAIWFLRGDNPRAGGQQ
jgi:hypothetical protein